MTPPRRWPNVVRPLPVLLAVLAVGCAAERDQRLAQLKSPPPDRDPLKGQHITPPNVPTGRDQYAKDRRDPLLRADARDDGTDPIRTPDRRTGGNVTGRDLALGSAATAEQMTSELQKAGAKVGAATRGDHGYEVRVEVPTRDGAKSWYTGGGGTPAAALKDAYDQVRSGWR